MSVKTAAPTGSRRSARALDAFSAAGPAPEADVATLMVISRSASERARLTALYVDAGFAVLEAADVVVAKHVMGATTLDLIVLECPSLVEAELAFCRTVAAAPRSRLLVLAATADLVDEIVALELGADDLLTGRIPERLLLARSRALLRRTRSQPATPSRQKRAAGWRLDPTTRSVFSPKGQRVLLSPSEASALHLFLSNPGVVFTCETGARALGASKRGAQGFRTTVCRLRKRLKPLSDNPPIQTVRGVGYVFGAPDAPVDREARTDSNERPRPH